MKKICLFVFLIFQITTFSAHSSTVSVKQDINGGWSLFVDDKPYFIRGMTYRVSKVGQSPDQGTLEDWNHYDFNDNQKIDSPYEAWVDLNKNNRQDPNEIAVGDFQLLKEMGINTIRWYGNDFKNQIPNKTLLRDLFANYGIHVAVGDKLGAYTLGSGASWDKGTDYRDPLQQEKMMQSVKAMVLEHKDEPYTLLWVLGNENNYAFTNTNAEKYPEIYAKFVNKVAEMIHQLDGAHPVALVNGDVKLIHYYAKHCPSIDIFGVNAYRGPRGFGSLWKEIKRVYDKPVLITEYGGSAAHGDDEDTQSQYHRQCWLDIEAHSAQAEGTKNAIGGIIYEWIDEWWKSGDPQHQAKRETSGKQGLGKVQWDQEYSGLVSQGNGKNSPFMRQLRKSYYMYKNLWDQSK